MKDITRILSIICLLLVGCSQKTEIGPVGELRAVGDEVRPVWPASPAPPRIRYLRSIEGAGDTGFEVPMVERLFEMAVGKADMDLSRPYAIAAEGRLLAVADPGVAAVHLMDLKGEFYKRVSTVGKSDLVSPVGIALGGGNVFVSDSVLNTVFVLDLDGQLVSQMDGLSRPTGLAYDPATQRLYVAETVAHRVSVFDAGGVRLFNITTAVEAGAAFNAPTHIAFRDGVLLINDTMNFRVVAMDGEGNFLWTFGTHGSGSGHFAQPKGVAIDAGGNILVADAMFNRVQIFDSKGRFLLAFGEPGRGTGQMQMPAGLFIADNRIFVADAWNNRVQIFDYIDEVPE